MNELVAPFLTGAVIAAALGLIGAWIQNAREHRRWIREQRFAAYREYMVASDLLAIAIHPAGAPHGPDRDALQAKLTERIDATRESSTVISFLGPDPMRHSALNLRNLILDFYGSPHTDSGTFSLVAQRQAGVQATREEFIQGARAVLKVAEKRQSFRMTSIW